VVDTQRASEFARLYKLAVNAAQSDPQAAHPLFLNAAQFAPELWCDEATQLAKDGEDGIALEHFRTALLVDHEARIRSGVFNNIGLILAKRAQMDEALEAFNEAKRLNPSGPDALSNIALWHKWRGNLTDARHWIDRALALNPWHSEAQFIQAMIALLDGDYKRGFELYECRWRSKTNGISKLEVDKPEWDGTNGKRVYVYGEQGAGDVILMLRYAKFIKSKGVEQIWIVPKGLKRLAERVSGICGTATVMEPDDPLPEFDCHIPAASLPRIAGTTIDTAAVEPYVPGFWQQVLTKPAMSREEFDKMVENAPVNDLFNRTGLHVGIVWRGSSKQPNDPIRSTNLEQWVPVLNVPGVTFHSLQVDGSDEGLLYPQLQMHDKPKDWAATAELVAWMDLVISVDTSMVHLCGAMGKPCWCALHCRPYFVYPLTRPDCPWYPSVKLFKQTKEFEWTPVFESIANELKTYHRT
jgi:tetratricopeptide (TPR) repeat protein